MNKQLLILLSGHNASGKSTLVKEIVSELDINQINGDIARDISVGSGFLTQTRYFLKAV